MRSRLGLALGMLLGCTQACGGAQDDGEPAKKKRDAASACVITRENPTGDDTAHYSYMRLAFDARSRVLTREWSEDSEFDEVTSTDRSLLDASGRMLVFASQVHNGMSFRFDRTFDDRGNMLENLATYTNDLELAHKPSGGHYSEQRYEQKYDDAGRLQETIALGPSSILMLEHWSYQSHDDGRCDSIVAEGGHIERLAQTFEYEGDRVSGRRDVQRFGDTEVELHTTLRYDAQDRLEAMEQDGDEHARSSADGRPDILWDYAYAADGGQTTTVVDYTTDTPSEELDRDGELAWADREITTYSPGCRALAEQLGRQPATECRFPMSLVPDLLEP